MDIPRLARRPLQTSYILKMNNLSWFFHLQPEILLKYWFSQMWKGCTNNLSRSTHALPETVFNIGFQVCKKEADNSPYTKITFTLPWFIKSR